MKPYALILLCLPLAGCDWLNKLENRKSDFQAYHEQVSAPQPQAFAASFYAPVVEPECTTDVFRVSRCVDGRVSEW